MFRILEASLKSRYCKRVGWARTKGQIYTYIRCTYGIFSREITIHTVIYGADIRFWPTLLIVHTHFPSSFTVLLQLLRLAKRKLQIKQSSDILIYTSIHVCALLLAVWHQCCRGGTVGQRHKRMRMHWEGTITRDKPLSSLCERLRRCW